MSTKIHSGVNLDMSVCVRDESWETVRIFNYPLAVVININVEQ